MSWATCSLHHADVHGLWRIIPTAGHGAQSLAILEQLAGVFYVAILIARLAGLYQPGAVRRSTWRMSGTDGIARPERKGRANRRLLRVAARLAQNDKRDSDPPLPCRTTSISPVSVVSAERREFGRHRASSITERERDKPMSYPTIIGCGRRGTLVAISLTLLLLAGCTSVSVDREVGAMEQLPPPDRVLVYNFAVTPQEIQLDAVGSAITKTFDGTANFQQEQEIGHAVANALAKRFVSDIQNMGLYAERAAGPVPPTGIDVLILRPARVDRRRQRRGADGHRPRRRP